MDIGRFSAAPAGMGSLEAAADIDAGQARHIAPDDRLESAGAKVGSMVEHEASARLVSDDSSSASGLPLSPIPNNAGVVATMRWPATAVAHGQRHRRSDHRAELRIVREFFVERIGNVPGTAVEVVDRVHVNCSGEPLAPDDHIETILALPEQLRAHHARSARSPPSTPLRARPRPRQRGSEQALGICFSTIAAMFIPPPRD